MKKLLLSTFIATALTTPQVFAQAKNFEGFSLYGGVNLANSTLEQNPKNGFSNASVTSSSSNFGLQAQYTLAVGNSVAVGFGASMGLGDLVFGRWVASGIDIKLKDTSSIYVAPGYAINDTTLLYGKIASVTGAAADTTSVSLSGLGYGVGAQIMMNKNTFYQFEWMQSNYSDKDFPTVVDKFKSSALSVGVGYKF